MTDKKQTLRELVETETAGKEIMISVKGESIPLMGFYFSKPQILEFAEAVRKRTLEEVELLIREHEQWMARDETMKMVCVPDCPRCCR